MSNIENRPSQHSIKSFESDTGLRPTFFQDYIFGLGGMTSDLTIRSDGDESVVSVPDLKTNELVDIIRVPSNFSVVKDIVNNRAMAYMNDHSVTPDGTITYTHSFGLKGTITSEEETLRMQVTEDDQAMHKLIRKLGEHEEAPLTDIYLAPVTDDTQ